MADGLDLLLVGKTGHGKSATGNSILGRSEFPESSGGESLTSEIRIASSDVRGEKVCVVDGPGVGDTALHGVEEVSRACQNMSDALTQNGRGFHTLLLVYRFGTRFTQEERAAIDMLKAILGDNLVRDYCVLVMTFGDTFDLQMKRNGTEKSFADWCREQGGELGQLMAECQYRCVLFHNMSEDPVEQQQQVDELFTHVRALKNRDMAYTHAQYQQAEGQRVKFMVQAKEPVIGPELMGRFTQLIQTLNVLQGAGKTPDQTDQELNGIEASANTLLQDVIREDQGTGVLTSVHSHVTGLVQSVDQARAATAARREEIQRQQQQEAERQKQIQEAQAAAQAAAAAAAAERNRRHRRRRKFIFF